MDVYRDEIFGPVLCVVRADSYDEALALINANPYGNGVAIFTRDGGAARRFEQEVEVGMVGINVPDPRAGRRVQLRRLAVVALRRQPHVRPRGRALLHAQQGRHDALARPGHQRRRPRVPAQPLIHGNPDREPAAHRVRRSGHQPAEEHAMPTTRPVRVLATAVLAAGAALVASAAPAGACGGLVGENGTIQLDQDHAPSPRTTTASSATSPASSSPARARRSARSSRCPTSPPR